MNAVIKIILKIDKVLQASFTKIDKAWYDKKRSRPVMRARNKIVQKFHWIPRVCVCACVFENPETFRGGGGWEHDN